MAKALDLYLPELARDLASIDRQRDRHDLADLERRLRNVRKKLGET